MQGEGAIRGRNTTLPLAARALAAVGRRFHARGWALGTGGNFSVVVAQVPLQLAITATGVDKGTILARHVLHVDETGSPIGRVSGKPSGETLLHLEIVRQRGAGAVMHTHSVWNTMLSDAFFGSDGFEIEGYEMLKGLEGVSTHEHREWIPIVGNDQNMQRLARTVGLTLDRHPEAHAILLRRHGLYTWGATLTEAVRHVEALEFLFEAVGRTTTLSAGKRGGAK
jgi:methylthioribulose-1-phosphate dehydratase